MDPADLLLNAEGTAHSWQQRCAASYLPACFQDGSVPLRRLKLKSMVVRLARAASWPQTLGSWPAHPIPVARCKPGPRDSALSHQFAQATELCQHGPTLSHSGRSERTKESPTICLGLHASLAARLRVVEGTRTRVAVTHSWEDSCLI